jgi:hypothetical protein
MKSILSLMIYILLLLLSHHSFALPPPVIRAQMLNYLSTNRDSVFQILTNKFQYVVLDCASFITGITFTNDNLICFNFYLDETRCLELHHIFLDAMSSRKPICLEIITDEKLLLITAKNKMECI